MHTRQNLRPAISRRLCKTIPLSVFFCILTISLPSLAQTVRLYSAEETKKMAEVEKVADRFIERWHETLDVELVFDEMLVHDQAQREKLVKALSGIFQFTDGDEDIVIDPDVDDETMRQAVMAFYNWVFLSEEYKLAFDESSPASPEIALAEKEMKKDGELENSRITADQLRRFTAKATELARSYRKSLPLLVFISPEYLARCLTRLRSHTGDSTDSQSVRLERGFSEPGGEKNVTVYRINRGIFEGLCFIEEEGEFRLLTLFGESSDWSK